MIEAYLHEVKASLKRALPAHEVDDIVAELRSHLSERSHDDGAAQAVASLGPAHDLAALYLAERLAERVAVKRGPASVLNAVYRMATYSIGAAVTLTATLTGYLSGALLIAAGLLKPFAPDRVGLWIDEAADGPNISLGITQSPPPGQEILGWWSIPLGLLLGAGLLLLTWRLSLAAVLRLGRAASRKRQVSD